MIGEREGFKKIKDSVLRQRGTGGPTTVKRCFLKRLKEKGKTINKSAGGRGQDQVQNL